MFCPSCGASNPADARFCNQCGVTLTSAPAAPPSTLSGPAPAAPPPSLQGARAPSQQGTTTLDRVELSLKGPSRRSFAIVGAITGVLGIVLGAALAYRSSARAPETIPVTPVGLIGEPAAVVAVRALDAGVAAPHERAGHAPRNAPRAPSTPGAREPSPPANSAHPANGTVARGESPAANAPPAEEPDPRAPSAPSAPAAASNGVADAGASRGASAALPPADPGGVIERGPRVTSGGYGLGDETDATGTMDGRVFSYVYNHYKSQISACYSNASRTRSVSGVIVLRVRIGTDGRVARTRVISDSARVPELATCVQTAVRAWRYPQPEGGEVEVDYPMRFGSGS